MKLTIEKLKQDYPNFTVTFHINRGKRSYQIHHLPTKKLSACILGNKLTTVERLIKECIERPDDYTNPLNSRSYFREQGEFK